MKEVVSLVVGSALIITGCMLAIPHAPSWPVLLLTLGLLFIAQGIRLSENDRMIVRIFAGIPFIIALSSTYFWSGVIAQCGILAIILAREELLPETSGPVILVSAGLLTLVFGAVTGLSNHMIVPFLVVILGILGISGILWVRLYRVKRAYRSEFS